MVVGAGIHFQHDGPPLGQADGGLEALGQPLLGLGPHAQAVDHHVYAVLFGFLQRRDAVDVQHLAVHAHPHETLGLQVGQFVLETALAVAHQRRQNRQPAFGRQGQRDVHHLADALRL